MTSLPARRTPAAFVALALLLGALPGHGAAAAPASFTLGNIRYERQGPDNCGPVTALTVLGYHGTRVTQAQAASALKDFPGDPQVTSLELAAYLGRFGLHSMIRSAGTPALVRELVSRGLPVVVQQRLRAGSNVAHFRTVYGYRAGRFLVSDPLLGPALWLSEAQFTDLWHFYNGEYLVAYPASKERDVQAVLGQDVRAATNWARLKRVTEARARVQSGDPYAWWGLGKANLRLGNVTAAAANFDRAVALGVPRLYFLYRQEAFEAWTKAGHHSKTLRYTRLALSTFPDSKELLYFRSVAQRGLGG